MQSAPASRYAGRARRRARGGCLVADLSEEDVGAGVEHERDAGLLSHRAHRGDLGGEVFDREQVVATVAQVLHVEPNRAGLDDTARGRRSGLGLVAVAGLHVGSDGQVDRAGDHGDRSEHLLSRQVLPIGVPERVGRGGARGRDRACPGASDHDSARRVPRVEQQQRIAGDVEVAEASALARWSMA